MVNDFEVRKYKPGDEDGIVTLLKRIFPKWGKRSVDYWKWKYLKSPLGTRVLVAVDGERIIGAFCDIPVRIWLGNHSVNGGYGDDTATDPDYREKGVYMKLLQLSLANRVNDGVTFSYWQTDNPIISKASTRYDSLVFPYQLCHLVKIKDVDKYLKNRGRDTVTNRLGFTLIKGFNTLVNINSSEKNPRREYTIVSIDDFDDGIDDFWEKVKKDYDYILEKKKDYLNWRYCSEGSDQYKVRLAKENDSVLGFSVLRLQKDETVSEGSIMDLLALTERSRVAEDLIDDALERFELMGVNSIYYQTVRGHPYKQLFESRGFIDVSKASRSIIYYRITDSNSNEFDLDSFSKHSPKSIYFNLY